MLYDSEVRNIGVYIIELKPIKTIGSVLVKEIYLYNPKTQEKFNKDYIGDYNLGDIISVADRKLHTNRDIAFSAKLDIHNLPEMLPLDFTFQRYNNSEKLIEMCNFNNGNGEYESFNCKFKTAIKCSYKNGKLHGSYLQWDINNKLILQCTYNCGLLLGDHERWSYEENFYIKSRYQIIMPIDRTEKPKSIIITLSIKHNDRLEKI
jgi:hypothetical protein